MKTMHLFAGIGGGLLADLILGHDPIIAVELDRYACQVLRERAKDGWFPNLSVWEGDVRLFDPSEYAGKVDCIHAGFPCQDISTAGKQAGVGEETRSGLYREALRIAKAVRPSELRLENVASIITNGLDSVIQDIAEIGYDAEWLCLRASDCGANHQRDRWWCRATLADSYGSQRKGGRVSSRTYKENTNLGSKGWWETEPKLDRVDNGSSHRIHRLKGLGNAQVPLQAAVAWKLLGGE